ncbi:MAG: putative peptide-modifying radical SAM/SPASM domain-containing protein [Thermoproteota archaeon]|nr:MAG: putative peptide-modifying radical SAM/SPASM domain-containing protein [Candidatus Korarchaeota archaeon]
MLYLIMTTGRCNLSCRYCGGSFPDSLVPWEVKYRLDDLLDFLSKDREPIVAFYGGEPLLNTKLIGDLLDSMEPSKLVIQTNGLLARKLSPRLWRRFDAVLLSIDGREEVTDYYRGRGVYKRVLEAAAYIRKSGFKGDLIARMTVSEKSSILRDVLHLTSLGVFDHIHWQLDAVWSRDWGFKRWLRESYMPELTQLTSIWARKLSQGEVVGLVPLLGVLRALLFEPNPAPPCEAGVKAFAISTSGDILACPIAVDVEWGKLGSIESASPGELPGRVRIGSPCTTCKYFPVCGGRCLYAYMERLWGEEGFRLVCSSVKHLIEEVRRVKPAATRLLEEGVLSREQLYYPKYNNTTEIIP